MAAATDPKDAPLTMIAPLSSLADGSAALPDPLADVEPEDWAASVEEITEEVGEMSRVDVPSSQVK
jgi:hypothetical protein